MDDSKTKHVSLTSPPPPPKVCFKQQAMENFIISASPTKNENYSNTPTHACNEATKKWTTIEEALTNQHKLSTNTQNALGLGEQIFTPEEIQNTLGFVKPLPHAES